jgi:hypothetical protein
MFFLLWNTSVFCQHLWFACCQIHLLSVSTYALLAIKYICFLSAFMIFLLSNTSDLCQHLCFSCCQIHLFSVSTYAFLAIQYICFLSALTLFLLSNTSAFCQHLCFYCYEIHTYNVHLSVSAFSFLFIKSPHVGPRFVNSLRFGRVELNLLWVSTGTTLHARRPRDRGSITDRGERYFSFPKSPDQLWGHPVFSSVPTEGSFTAIH